MPKKIPIDWSNKDITKLLGVVPDQDVADIVGCTRERVRQIREERRILDNRTRARIAREKAFAAALKALPAALKARLGQANDCDLAEEYAADVKVVRQARLNEGLPRFTLGCGTARGYQRGCRCEACTTANRERVYKWNEANPKAFLAIRERRVQRVLDSAPHTRREANISTYACGCRCDECRRAGRLYDQSLKRATNSNGTESGSTSS